MIKVEKDPARITRMVEKWKRDEFRVGFVPTMGALHRGHMSLVELALKKTDRVLVSIFVNPSQFGPEEDLESYPRDLDKDVEYLEEAGVHAVFCPTEDAVYPPSFSTEVHVSGLTRTLCGKYRQGHFDGVATVCAVLFGIVRPHIAVFGRKDAQQLAVIRRMVADLRMDVEIVAGDIVREPGGLALSSRNSYLTAEEREQALVIHRSLKSAEEMFRKGERNSDTIIEAVLERISSAPLAEVQYVEIVDPNTMEPLRTANPPALLAVAVYFGHTRLIDNVVLKPRG
ncbi:MAG: pantoate--beta-alanine ligase [Candidatus Aegiribacteria sp.]|nr:pantoate--beta-alanine ligase [Candidatus Aegiribacteria sp.]